MDERLSISQLDLKSLLIFIEGQRNCLHLSIYVYICRFFGGINLEMHVTIIIDGVRPLYCCLIELLSYFGYRPFNIQLQTIIFQERRSISNLSYKVTYALSAELLSEVPIKGLFLFTLDINTGDIVILDLFFYLFNDQLIFLMDQLIRFQLFFIGRMNDVVQSLFFSLKLFLQDNSSFLIVLDIFTDFLFTLACEMHSNTLIKLGFGHLIQLLLEHLHGLLKGNMMQGRTLALILHHNLLELLIVTLEQIDIHSFLSFVYIILSTIIQLSLPFDSQQQKID